MSQSALIISKSWMSGYPLTKDSLDTAMTDIENWARDVKYNLDQLRIDTQGAAYSYDNDGLANYPRSLRDEAMTTLSEPGITGNLGLSYSGNLLSITDADQVALSADNEGFVVVPGTTAGQNKKIWVSAGGTLDDTPVTGHLNGFGFGITTTVDWAEDMPFYIYVANKDDTNIDGTDGASVFFISRSPCMALTPSDANYIGDHSAAPVTDSVHSIFIMSDVTVADYTSLPCVCIGAFRMQYTT